MLYTDGRHLIADSLIELFGYADKMGLSRKWVDTRGKSFHPHFDICGHVRKRVLHDKDVKQVSTKEIVRLARLNYRLPETDKEVKEWEAYHNQSLEEIEKPTENEFKNMFKRILKRAGIK